MKKNPCFCVTLKLHLLFALSFVLIPQSVIYSSERKNRIVILDFTADRKSQNLAGPVRTRIEKTIFTSNTFDVLDHRGFTLKTKYQKNFAQIMKKKFISANTDYLVTGSIDKLDKYTIILKVIDVRKGNLIAIEARESPSSKMLIPAAAELAEKIKRKITNRNQKQYPDFPNQLSCSFHTKAGYIMPTGYFREIAGRGYSIIFSACFEDIFFKNSFLIAETGYLYFKGIPFITHHTDMMPFLLGTGYRLKITDFFIIPSVCTGGSYNRNFYYADSDEKHLEKKKTQPALKVCLSFEYIPTQNIKLQMGPSFTNIFEKNGAICFFSFNAGAGLRF